jgi:hypothetical protein
MYKQKYLKYKKKYLNLHKDILESTKNGNIYNQEGGAPEYTIIKKGSFLYRCAPNIEILETLEGRRANVKVDGDTSKNGLYFGNQAIISLSMCIEYDRLMPIGIFKVTQDIDNVTIGKFAFREINPERYYDDKGDLIPGINIIPRENVSHIQCNLQLLGSKDSNDAHTFLLPLHIQHGLDCLSSCEIFLIPEHLDKIELVDVYEFNPANIRTAEELHDYMKQNHYPFYIDKYIEDDILIHIKNYL